MSEAAGLDFKTLVELAEGGYCAGLANGRQVCVDDGRIEGIVSQVSADLPQRDAFLEQMCGIAVPQRVGGRGGVDPGYRTGHSVSGLYTAFAHRLFAQVHGLAEGQAAVSPTATRT